jgi:hypothetical protein
LSFTPRKSLQYNPIRGGTSSQGGSYYSAKNPDYGALFTYYIKEGHSSLKEQRQEREKEIDEGDIGFPGWEALDAEMAEPNAEALLVVTDTNGNVIDRIPAPLKKGVHRISWDLKKPLTTIVDPESKQKKISAWRLDVSPGTYIVSLFKRVGGELTQLAEAKSFEVVRIRENILNNPLGNQREAYVQQLLELNKSVDLAEHYFNKASKRIAKLEKTLKFVKMDKETLTKEVYKLRDEKTSIQNILNGSPSKSEVGEKGQPTLGYRLYFASNGLTGNTYGPTALHMESFAMASEIFKDLEPRINHFVKQVDQLTKKLEAAGAPLVVD